MGSEPEETHEEALAKLRAAADQARAGLSEIAEMLASYYLALQEKGFNSEEAFGLVLDYQRQLMSALSEQDDS